MPQPRTEQIAEDALKDIIWKDEMNLCELPVSTISDRTPDGLTALDFYVTEADGETVRRISVIPPGDDQLRKLVEIAYPGLVQPVPARTGRRRKGEVEPAVVLSPKVEKLLASVRGLPNPTDEDVLLALIQLTRKNGFQTRRVNFSLYEVVKLLGWDDGSKSYTRVIVSLLRWKAVLLTYHDSWRDNSERRWKSRTFNMLDEVTIYSSPGRRARDSGNGQGALPFSSFLWSEAIFKSFEDGYLKNLDFRKYKSLNTRIAKRMYRFLDKCFGRLKTPSVSFDLRDFACGHIGLIGDYEPWKLKQVLAPGIRELEANGIITPLPLDKRYETVGRGKSRIVFHPAKAVPVLQSPNQADDVAGSLIKTLEQKGVTRSTAQALVKEFPAERIQRQLDVLEWWQDTEREPKIKEPGAWLRKAVQEEYALPKEYESKAERERKKTAGAEAIARRKAEAAEKKRKEQEELATKHARQKHVTEYLEALSDADRLELEARAIEAGEAYEQQTIQQKGPGSSMLRRILIEREVLRVCPLSS